MPSYKIDEAIRLLPENNFNASQAMRQAGYTLASSRAGTTYEILRKRLEKIYSPEAIKAKIDKTMKRFEKEGDNSNYARLLELEAKIVGLGKETNTNIAIFNDKIIEQGLPRVDVSSNSITDNVDNKVKDSVALPNSTNNNGIQQ